MRFLCCLSIIVLMQQILRHRRHNGARKQIAGQHRENHGLGHRHKQIRATPLSRNIGTNTMQIASVETSAGVAICAAPSRIACSISLPCSRLRLMFSISTVASSTRMPTASASPPSVMMLIVSCSSDSTVIEHRIDSGIETAIISVERQLPRKTRIITAVRQAAISASRTTPLMAPRTKITGLKAH